MLDASNDNSWATTKSSSIKSYKLSEIPNSFISFRLIMIVTFKTSKSNQCPQDWFNTQAFSIKNKISTII
jgi:phosphomevalonate kinase